MPSRLHPLRRTDPWNKVYKSAYYPRPQFCHKCGQPYPWMKDRIETVHELLENDKKLTKPERDELSFSVSPPTNCTLSLVFNY